MAKKAKTTVHATTPAKSADPAVSVSSTDNSGPITSQEREQQATTQLASLISDCTTWEKSDATSRSQLYKLLENCARTLELSQHPNDGSEQWLKADALHKAIKDAVRDEANPKLNVKNTSYFTMRTALLFLAFPLSRGSDGASRDMRYRFRKVLIACKVNKHIDDAATWIESEGGVNVIARNYDIDGIRKEKKPDPDAVELDPMTWAEATGDTQQFADFLSTIENGQGVVLIGHREGDKVVVIAATRHKAALKWSTQYAAKEITQRNKAFDGKKEAA